MSTPKRTFRMFVEEELGEIPHFVVGAVLEWMLIVSLFVDSFLAYISSKFAHTFELEPPCVLCTRIDHALTGKNSNSYYNDSICELHKKDISSLGYCHVHRKLSDIRNMCEGCLLSFATEKEAESDQTSKAVVGVLQKTVDVVNEEDRKMFMKPGNDSGFESSGRCSCCGDPLKNRTSSKAKVFARSSSSLRISSSPRATITPRAFRPENEGKPLELSNLRFMSDEPHEPEIPEDDGLNIDNKLKEDTKSSMPVPMPMLPDAEELTDESCKTPSFIKTNKFFGIPLTDSNVNSPRWANRLPKKNALEKSDFNPDSFFNDDIPTEGADPNTLKRQLRSDRKMLITLYMELNEERSASAVAANNAMAMITRLQAEKAAVQMEALQYQRMMEEQAEYDQEAIQVLKDLLVKKEKDIKVMELELETYREKHGEIKKVGSEECEADADDGYQELKSQSLSSYGEKSEKSECGSPEEREHNGYMGENVSSLDFETERSKLFEMLKELENHIQASPEDDQENPQTSQEHKATLRREMSMIRERLRAIEADSGFLKHTAMTLQKGDDGAKLLTEIAQHLRKLRDCEQSEDTKATTDT